MAGTLVLSLTGASGAGYAVELLRGIDGLGPTGPEVVVIMNSAAEGILLSETGYGREELARLASGLLDDGDMRTPFASGSNRFDWMVICPCTTSTACKIANGIADTLTTRCASVALKEKRKLVLAVRETPFSAPVLKCLYDLSNWGVSIMVASPSFYGGERTVADIQRSFSGRILDLLGFENDIASRYKP